jgi:hypothetical protein
VFLPPIETYFVSPIRDGGVIDGKVHKNLYKGLRQCNFWQYKNFIYPTELAISLTISLSILRSTHQND